MKFISPVGPKTATVENVTDNSRMFWRDGFNADTQILEIKSIAKINDDYYLAGVNGTSTKYIVSYDLIEWEDGFFPIAGVTEIPFIVETYNNIIVSEINTGTISGSYLRLRSKNVRPFIGTGFASSQYVMHRYKKVRYNDFDYVLCVGFDSLTPTKLTCVLHKENESGATTIQALIEIPTTFTSMVYADLVDYLSNIEFSEYEESFVFMMTKSNTTTNPIVIYVNINEAVTVVEADAFFLNKKCTIRYFYNNVNTNYLTYIAVNGGGLYYSTDDVVTYSTLVNPAFKSFSAMELNTTVVDSEGSIYFIEHNQNFIYKSTFEIGDMATSVTMSGNYIYPEKEIISVRNSVEFVENKFLTGDTIVGYNKEFDSFIFSYKDYRRGDVVLFNDYKYRALKSTIAVPANDEENWELIGFDNRLACINNSYSFSSTSPTEFTVILDYSDVGERIDYLCILNVLATYIKIYINDVLFKELEVSSFASEGSWHDYFFGLLDPIKDLFIPIDAINPVIKIELSGGDVSLGYVFGGYEQQIGTTMLDTSIQLLDFSRKEADADGNYFLEERKDNKNIDFNVSLMKEDVNPVFNIIRKVKALPTIWYDNDINDTNVLIYGFVKDFSVVFSTNVVVECNLTIEGMS